MSKELTKREVTPDDTGDGLVSTAIVRAVAAAEGVGPLDLQPLGQTIDTDALDRIVDSMPVDGAQPARLEFPYAGYTVGVSGDGGITIESFES